ncbi:glycosyltransferase family 61 protein [Methylobrevis pamukkalensis]|uniref:Glycosyltransferase 61 catalytic domain-containing protein n=1 Tax=Methylobrevis pamukkalensis TaxID=1439726 RepID=A0A1E3GZB8_9HYPH|nr:glycosyltransferase family 61 protein [Methylobrevis pamukkalensis]ODN69418.1 hypothetical protein A6302_03286 [Methylobrevis pamukkalensis]
MLGNTGQAVASRVDRGGAGGVLTAIDRNTSKPSRLSTRRIEGAAVNFLHHRDGVSNYYHYLAERCVVMAEVLGLVTDEAPNLTLLTREGMAGIEQIYLNQILRRFPGVRVQTVAPTEKIVCDQLFQHRVRRNSGFRSPPTAASLTAVADTFESAYGLAPPAPPHRRLLVSREDARIRRLVGEDALMTALAPLGFERICPGQLAHEAQIALFREAAWVIGAHGAGLTNLMFMPAGGRVIEIFSEDYCQGAYMWLSHLRQLDYTPVVTSTMGAHQTITLSAADIEAIRRLVAD